MTGVAVEDGAETVCARIEEADADGAAWVYAGIPLE